MPTSQINTRLDSDLLRALRIEAVIRDVTIAQIVTEALLAYLPARAHAPAAAPPPPPSPSVAEEVEIEDLLGQGVI